MAVRLSARASLNQRSLRCRSRASFPASLAADRPGKEAATSKSPRARAALDGMSLADK